MTSVQSTHHNGHRLGPSVNLTEPGPPSPSSPLIDHRAGVQLMQRPGCDVHLARWVYGGPTCGFDVRFIFDRQAVGRLCSASAGSVTGRARADGVALLVEQYRGTDGNVFELWSPLALRVRPEPSPLSPDPDGPLNLDAEPTRLSGAPIIHNVSRVLLPDQPALIHRSVYAPKNGIARMFFGGAMERDVLQVMRRRVDASLVGRARMECVGLIIDVYLPEKGDIYEVWTLAGSEPKAENG